MRIRIGGSAANPPHLGHKLLLERLVQSGMFDKVYWIPSGIREDKANFVPAYDRVNMTSIMFSELDKAGSPTEVHALFDDAYGQNNSTIWWLEKFQAENPGAEVIWYTGVDSVVPLEKYGGRCEIEAEWVCGEELMRNWKFLIIPRKGFPNPHSLILPRQFKIFDADLPDIRSSVIKELIVNGQPFEHLVGQKVARYIKDNNLYR